MKTKMFQRVSIVALSMLLLVALLLSGAGIGEITASAADYIGKFNGDITTNFEDYLNSDVIYRLPDTIQDTDQISVIVKLNDPAIADVYQQSDKSVAIGEFALSEQAQQIRDRISEDKKNILAALDECNVTYRTGKNYATVLSGFEIVIQASDFETVVRTLGKDAMAIVGEVYKVAETQLVENEVNFDESTGIFDSTGFAYDGSGMLVAVLDTGLDYTHSAFSMANFTSTKLGLTKDEVAKLLGDTKAASLMPGLTADDVYVSDKVPFSFDYADEDADVYSLHNNHGTHVSGVIVGHDDVIRGVAPNAQLVSMKIFSDVRESAYTSWILAALEDCVILGVDVINMSLGTACGFSREMDKEAVTGVYDRIREMGISLVVAASNSFNSAYASDRNGNLGLTTNPDTSTVGSPSTYQGAMSVASIKGVKTPYLLFGETIIYFDESTNASTEENNFFNGILPEGVDAKDFEFITIPGAGREADYMGIDVKGKIVLVERGFNTFEEKANAAQKNGAAGVIIYNNVSGEIKMNVGTATIPVCSINQDDGKMLAAQKTGTIKISRTQTSGPFMSDFSSWGPTPDLGIKPEITAHGGNILSAVTGGGYDRLSGTSMACPNMAGVVALLRQHVMEKYPDIANDPVEVNARINRLLMSTADIVLNTNGLPYAVRKQGAGLANLTQSSQTPAYILTYDRLDGSVMDKTKIELGDDPTKSGVYTLTFAIQNFEGAALSYNLSAIVMTEGVSDTKTSHGETTVTEDGYLLSPTVTFVVENGTQNGNTVTVNGNSTAKVTVTITLSDADKTYLDSSFANGMYVEGFVILDAVSGTDIDLNVPYLAFYGDWTVAPMFDRDYFETNADELDDSIAKEDKNMADAYATRPIGGVSEDYVSYLGSYYFLQNPAATKVISASRDYIALSNVDGTVHSLRFVWTGLLRNAERIEITITDDATGEIIYTKTEHDVRKSYGDGGSIYPANVKIEFDVGEHNLKNNTEYTVRLVGYLDYGDGGIDTNQKNVFEFPFVTDFEAPAVTGCEFFTEYDKDLKKNRLYARLAVYDNHYTMAMMLGYVTQTTVDGQLSYEMKSFEQYLTPVYSVRDGVTYVEYELTDYIQDIKNNSVHKNTFTVACYDYALNEATYEISLPDEFIDFYFEESEITLSPNELYNLVPLMYPNTEWGELLHYASSNPNVATVVNDKIIATGSGTAIITAYEKNDDGTNGKSTNIKVTVLSEGDEGFMYYDKPVADVFELIGFETLKVYYQLNSSDRELGEKAGDYTVLNKYSLEFYPSESIQLHYKLDAYFPKNTTVVFSSSNDRIVTIDDQGVITAQAEGFASITVQVMMDGIPTYYSQSLDIEVKDPFITSAPALSHYFGLGGVVEIPDTLLITQIGQYAFSNYQYVSKTEDDIISEDEPDLTKPMYIGDNTITKVIIPEGVKVIGPYAFAGLTALQEVVLPSTLESIEYGAFYGCVSLKKVTGIEHVKLINKDAFFGCNITGTLSLDSARAVGDFAFANNKNIKEIIFPETLQSIGEYAFYGNTKLETVTVKAEKVKYGPYVFAECTSLTEIEINTGVIPTGAFNGAEKLSKVIIGKDVASIGEYAFKDTAVTTFTVAEGNKTFKAQKEQSYLVSADGKTLMLVAPYAKGEFKPAEQTITTIGKGAFSSNGRRASGVTHVIMPNVTVIEDYAFAYCNFIESLQLGQLTYIGDYAFFNSNIGEYCDIPALDNVKEIGKYAFAYTKITSLEIPAGMIIGEGAFTECSKLQSVVIGDDVVIGKGAFMLDRFQNSQLIRDPAYPNNKYYSFEYLSPLTSLVIGDRVVIGDSAFMGASKLTSVTLGEGVTIGDQAFYNACSLQNIDLSQVVSIGKGAFSGDQLYMYGDENQNSYALTSEGELVYKYYAAKLTEIDLSSAEFIGEQAFLYCKQLVSVHLGDKITEIPSLAFYECESLTNINLDHVVAIRTNAFVKTALTELSLTSVELIEKYAFVYCDQLIKVTLNEKGTAIEEGAFAYCSALATVQNDAAITVVGPYAFAYTAITSIDLTSATSIGDHAFLKTELTDFDVTLGSALVELGENPFSFCRIKPFSTVQKITFNGKEFETEIYTFNISESVFVIDGSLYYQVPNGLELVTYAGLDANDVRVADGTVRITAMAFAGSDVVRIELPHTLASIGHKAFFDCERLSMVVFTGYEAPNLEEEFDASYYESYDNLPATGSYDFTLWTGELISKDALGIVPYYMWNLTDGKYCNVYYGANFVDYVGKVDSYLVMVRPSNGQYYDTFIYGKYFTVTYDGSVAADDTTLAAIAAINKVVALTQDGGMIRPEHEPLIVAARQAYDKIATKEQQALVTNLNALLSAEDRIASFKDMDVEPEPELPVIQEEKDATTALIVIVVIESVLLLAVAVLAVLWFVVKKRKNDEQEATSETEEAVPVLENESCQTAQEPDQTSEANEEQSE